MGRSHHIYTVFSFGTYQPMLLFSSLSSQTAETEWEEEGGSQPIMSHLSYFSFFSPFPLPLILFFPCFSQFYAYAGNVLSLLAQAPMFSSLHVNTHPKCITGTVLHLHAVQHTADGFVTPAKAYRSDSENPVPPSTTVNYNPNPEPTGGNVAPSMDINQPHPHPPAFFARCCLVILPWQSPCHQPALSPRETVRCSNLCLEN